MKILEGSARLKDDNTIQYNTEKCVPVTKVAKAEY